MNAQTQRPASITCDPLDNLREQQLRAEIVWLRQRLHAMSKLRVSQERMQASVSPAVWLDFTRPTCSN